MPENSPKTLSCPSCGAPLEFDGSSSLIRCKFCKTTAVMPGMQAQQTVITPGSLEAIRALAESGNMLEAVRRFREMTGVGLKEAKTTVELLTSGKVMVVRQTVSGPLSAEETSRILEQVQELLRADDKKEAVRRYQEATAVSMVKAREVVEQVEAALRGIQVQTAPAIMGELSSVEPEVKRRRSVVFAVLALSLILLLVGGAVGIAMVLGGGTFHPMLIANGPVSLVVSGSDTSGMAAAFYHLQDETYKVGMVDPGSGSIRWLAEPVPGGEMVNNLTQAGDMVFAASQTDLLAYLAEDGRLAWRAVMPDRLNYSDASLLITAGRVLTNTIDQSVQAYDAASGRLVWDRRLAGYDRSLRLVDGSLMIFDQAGEDYTYSLFFLDTVDGSEQRVLTPTCPTDEFSPATLDPDSGLLYDAGENALFLVYDSSPGCIERLDLASGQPVWQTLDDAWYSFSADGFNSLLTDERLYFSTGDRLVAVEKRSGLLQTILAEADYELLPLAVTEEALIVRFRRTRGSELFELRGIEPATGRMLWRMDMGDAKPLDPPDEMIGLVDEGEPGWTWHLGTDGLVLVQFQAAPNQLLVQTLDPASGSLRAETVIPLRSVEGDFYSVPEVIGWVGDLFYFTLDADIYCVDLATGEVIFHT